MLYSPVFPAQGMLSRELCLNLLPVRWYETRHWVCNPDSSLHDMKRRRYWRRQTFDAACQFKGTQSLWIQPTKKLELLLRSFTIILKKSSRLLRKSAKKTLSLYIVICKVAFSCPFGLGRAGKEDGEMPLHVTCYPVPGGFWDITCVCSYQIPSVLQSILETCQHADPKHPNL